jgi:hypothetical protein
MQRLLLGGLAAVLLATAPAASAAQLVPRDLSSLARYPQAMVQVAGNGSPSVEARLRRAGGKEVSARHGIWTIPSDAAQRLVPGLAVAGAITDVEADPPRYAAARLEVTDPLFALEWWLPRVGAASVASPGPGRPVTVIDSGLDTSHPEFVGRANTTLLNVQSVTGQREFHGTAVSSVVAAPANGLGVVGIYPNAVLNSWDASPSGFLSASDVIAGIEAAAARGPGVINLSLGGPDRSAFEALSVADAFAGGSIVVAAAGNDRESGSPLSYPASYPHVVTVGSTDAGDAVSSFSSKSPGMDVAAPGEEIPIAIPTRFSATGFGSSSGTSFAAPIVSGAIAWIWTARPELEKTQLIELVRRSARDLSPVGRDSDTGFGLLDVARALTLAAPAVDPSEPNDDGARVARLPPLTAPGRGRATLSARVDTVDDPRDLYRVFVPAGSRVTATLRSTRAAGLGVQGPLVSSVSARATGTGTTRTLTLTNRGARGVYVRVSVLTRPVESAAETSYTLRLTTARAPR